MIDVFASLRNTNDGTEVAMEHDSFNRNVASGCTLLGLLVVLTLAAGAQQLPRFDFPFTHARWLWYYEYTNAFDTCIVRYTVGEFALLGGDTVALINLRVPKAEVRYGGLATLCVQGSSALGRDSLLESRGKTQPFEIRSGSALRFYRRLEGTIVCDTTIEPPRRGRLYPSAELINTVDEGWYLFAGCIPDRTEFVLELVRESDGTVLLTLDSIGVLPNPNAPKPVRYGTEPDRRVRTVALPQSLWGERAYVRISPRRWGPTPYGMTWQAVSRFVAESLFYPDSDTLARIPAWLDSAYVAGLWNERNRAIFAFVDSVGRCTGCATCHPIFLTADGDTAKESAMRDSLIGMIDERGYVRAGNRNPYDLRDTALQRCFALQFAEEEQYVRTFDEYDSSYSAAARSASGVTIDRWIRRHTPRPGELLSLVTPFVREGDPVVFSAAEPLGSVTIRFFDISGRLAKEFAVQLHKGTNLLDVQLVSGGYFVEVSGSKLPQPLRKAILVVR